MALSQISIISISFTIGIDLLITVAIEKINILLFPINIAYLIGWFIIIPSVILAGYKKLREKQ